MKFFPLILRNTFRNRRRTILTVLSIGISVISSEYASNASRCSGKTANDTRVCHARARAPSDLARESYSHRIQRSNTAG